MDASRTNEDLVPLARIGAFVRQLAHDIRNGLNGIDLQSALIQELASDPELREETKRLRALSGDVTKSLQKISNAFADISLSSIVFPVDEFLAEFRNRLAGEFSVESVKWQQDVSGAQISVDVEAMITALIAVFRNAFQFRQKEGELRFSASLSRPHVIFELAEKKDDVPSDPARWGMEPLVTTRRGGYGLGLFQARKIIAAHGATLESRFENGVLTTTVQIPIAV